MSSCQKPCVQVSRNVNEKSAHFAKETSFQVQILVAHNDILNELSILNDYKSGCCYSERF